MVKPIRVGPHGRTVRIDPQSRTPSTESDEIIIIYPQGQVHRDSGEEGDNGRVEDSPNRRQYGGVGVSDEAADDSDVEWINIEESQDENRDMAKASEAPVGDGAPGAVVVGVAEASEAHIGKVCPEGDD